MSHGFAACLSADTPLPKGVLRPSPLGSCSCCFVSSVFHQCFIRGQNLLGCGRQPAPRKSQITDPARVVLFLCLLLGLAGHVAVMRVLDFAGEALAADLHGELTHETLLIFIRIDQFFARDLETR